MSTEDEPKKLSETDPQATPAWHRARAQRLRKNGFMKMALEHEQIGVGADGVSLTETKK